MSERVGQWAIGGMVKRGGLVKKKNTTKQIG